MVFGVGWRGFTCEEFIEQALHEEELYSLRMKEGTSILQHIYTFNRILSDLLALEVKLEKKIKLFCYTLLFHLLARRSFTLVLMITNL